MANGRKPFGWRSACTGLVAAGVLLGSAACEVNVEPRYESYDGPEASRVLAEVKVQVPDTVAVERVTLERHPGAGQSVAWARMESTADPVTDFETIIAMNKLAPATEIACPQALERWSFGDVGFACDGIERVLTAGDARQSSLLGINVMLTRGDGPAGGLLFAWYGGT